jgi:hypothetical protein
VDELLTSIENPGRYMNQARVTALLCGAVSAMFLAGCGGSSSSNASIAGNVTGLAAGTTVTLADNGADSLKISANGNFVFAGKLSSQSGYNVTVATQPAGQTCLVSNGSGLIDLSGSDVSNVAVNCAANLSVGGLVTGLVGGATVTLQNNFADALVVSNGTYAFPTLLTLGSVYSVTVQFQPTGQPTGQVCTVSNYTGGVVSLLPITNVNITCKQAI